MKSFDSSRTLCAGLLTTAFLVLRIADAASPTEPVGWVKAGSVWHYANDGKDQGDAWRLPDFDTTAWRSGPAQLGYGDGDEATLTRDGKPPHPLTAYFRTEFQVADTGPIGQLLVRLVRDDGVVVYLNGKELLRDNMPAGEVRFDTPAATTASDENAWRTFETDTALLRNGRNVLVAEVHQANPESSDLSFDLALWDRPSGPPVVSVVAVDPEAREMSPMLPALDSAKFRLCRNEGAASELTVFFSVGGTAKADADYKALGHSAVFKAGEHTTELEVVVLDDLLVEGDEAVVVKLEPDPSMGPIERYRIAQDRAEAKAVIHDDDSGPDRPLVRIEVVAPETPEFCPPNARCMPGRFLISRAGSTAKAQPVFLWLRGTAKNGVDYQPLPFLITIPAGQPSTDVVIAPMDDELAEGNETVVAEVSPCPPPEMGLGMPCFGFEVDPAHAKAAATILDNERPSDSPRIEITMPKDGAQFGVGEVVRVEAVAVDPKGFIARLEYFANDSKIGESSVGWPECVGCEPKPGDPAKHVFEWKGAATGRYELVARATQRIVFQPGYEEQPIDPPAVSARVRVAVGGVPPIARFSIVATRPVAEESSFPYRRLPLVGEFTISRGGDLTEPASVFVHYEGEAENGVDCEPLPWQVKIPAGEKAVSVEVKAIPDKALEGAEKLVARLSPCPPRTEPPLGAPCVAVEIDPDRSSAAVVICDDARCGQAATLQITAPKAGERFPVGTAIAINAVAVDPLGAITRAEFWADERQIGVSEIWFIRAPDPGTPIHHEFVWKDARPGSHTLSVRAKDSAGLEVVSAPVRIQVGEQGLVQVAILKPLSGAVFAPGDTVEIRAKASAVPGPVAQLEIYGDDQLLGSTKDGELTVGWERPPAGMHVLTAHAVTSDGLKAVSAPVRILVREMPALSFVERHLPPAYLPGVAFEVKLVATPPRLGSAWAVAEQPPAGWKVDRISDDGVFDTALGQVKFGPYTDLLPRTLTYQITPPATAQGRQEFAGQAALDGTVVAIGGDRVLQSSAQTHPADLDPNDFAIDLAEVSAYAAAWKQGQPWPVAPVPIPLSYVTRAGQIWRQGEMYVYDASQGPPPECWLPAKGGGQPGLHDLSLHRAERSLAGPATPGATVEVRIAVTPDGSVGAFAVEEQLPPGWAFGGADNGAAFEAARRQIRWGPFYTAQPQVLTYRVAPPADTASFAPLVGRASFDGHDQPILGAKSALAEDARTAVGFRGIQRNAGAVRFEVGGLPGQLCQIESSTDLIDWVPHQAVFVLEGGNVEFEDDAPPVRARFFRVRPAANP